SDRGCQFCGAIAGSVFGHDFRHESPAKCCFGVGKAAPADEFERSIAADELQKAPRAGLARDDGRAGAADTDVAGEGHVECVPGQWAAIEVENGGKFETYEPAKTGWPSLH